MEGFVGEEEDFIGDVRLDREPVETDEDDVLPGLSVGENPAEFS